MTKLPREFYIRDTVTVAKELLGKSLTRATKEGITTGIIVETEAYKGKDDPASHFYSNKITDKTKIGYEQGGLAYVYSIYGVYYCLGIVTEKKFEPGAVLVRAVEPKAGIQLMAERRGFPPMEPNLEKKVCSGPSKLCQAFAIDKSLYGENLTGDSLWVSEGKLEPTDSEIASSIRVGIDYTKKGSEYKWRFFMKDNPFISVSKVTEKPARKEERSIFHQSQD
ncbi:DNA-3-methyladenine glycosylase [Candidatus Dojkabacteria bacterium]|nr:DNA-3-methyladenine glycosylase [Candidatus Dojkabacteria bacterium]